MSDIPNKQSLPSDTFSVSGRKMPIWINCLFWGNILLFVQFSLFPIYLIGFVLILSGLDGLFKLKNMDESYYSRLRLVRGIVYFELVVSLGLLTVEWLMRGQFIDVPKTILARNALGLFALAILPQCFGMIVLCRALQMPCEKMQFDKPVKGLRTTRLLLLWFLVFPFLVLWGTTSLLVPTETFEIKDFTFKLTPDNSSFFESIFIIFVLVFGISIIHFFVSLTRAYRAFHALEIVAGAEESD